MGRLFSLNRNAGTQLCTELPEEALLKGEKKSQPWVKAVLPLKSVHCPLQDRGIMF